MGQHPEAQAHLDTLLSLPEKPRSKNTATSDGLHLLLFPGASLFPLCSEFPAQ